MTPANEFHKDGGYYPVNEVNKFNNTVDNDYGKSKYLKLKYVPTTGYLFITGTLSDHQWFTDTNLVGINKGCRFNYGLNKFSNNTFNQGKTIVNNCNKLIKQKRLDPLMNEGLTIKKWLLITGQDSSYKPKIDSLKEKLELTFNDIYLEFLKRFKEIKKGLKSYNSNYSKRFKKFEVWLNDNTLFSHDNLLKWFESIDHSDSKKCHLNELIDFLNYKQDVIKREFNSHLLTLEKYKKDISTLKIKKNNSYVPTDSVILDFFNQWYDSLIKVKKGLNSHNIEASKRVLNRLKIIAIYGLRCHELIYILNWSEPVLISNNEFIQVTEINQDMIDNFDDNKDYLTTIKNSYEKLIPAIIDHNNKDFELVIGDGKTGKRIVFPSNKQWLFDFGLLEYKTLKDCIYYQYCKNSDNYESIFLTKDADDHYIVTKQTTLSMYRKNIEINFPLIFTPHKLRHACNIRLHKQGYNVKAISDNLGHTMTTNTSTYLKLASDEAKYDNQKEHFSSHKTYSQLEQELKQAKEQILFLTKQLEQKELENNQLKQKLTNNQNIIFIDR